MFGSKLCLHWGMLDIRSGLRMSRIKGRMCRVIRRCSRVLEFCRRVMWVGVVPRWVVRRR